MSTHALQTAAAKRAEARDSVTLDVLVKALVAGVTVALTSRLGIEAAVASAVLATFVAEGVKQFLKRRNWGIKRVGFLVALTTALGSIDTNVGRGARKVLGEGSRVLDVVTSGAGRVALTTAAATATVTAVAVPQLVTGSSGDLTLRGTQGTVDIGPGQIARLSFDARAGERVFVEITESDIGATLLSLQDPAGKELPGATYAYKFLDTQRLASSGTYDVVLDPLAELSGTATVRVLRVPPDVVEAVQLKEAQRGTFNTVIGQNAALQFTGVAGERVFVEITDSNLGTTTLSLHGPDGNELPGATYAYRFLDTQRLPASGTYRVVLDPWDNNYGRASVRVVPVPPDLVETVELNTVGRRVTFDTAVGQNAALRFQGKAGDRVSVEIVDSTSGTTTLSLMAPAGKELASTYAFGHLDGLRLPATGTYRVVLDPWDNNHGRVTVRIRRD